MSKRNLLALLGVASAVCFATWSFSGSQVAEAQFVPQQANVFGQPVVFTTVNRYQLTVLPSDARRELAVFDTTNGHCWIVDSDGAWHDLGTPPEKQSSTPIALPAPPPTQAPTTTQTPR
jgi:hypothetical protein